MLKPSIRILASLIGVAVVMTACKPDLDQKSAARLVPDGMSMSNVYKVLGPDAVVTPGNDGEICLSYFFTFFPPPPMVTPKIRGMTVIISNNVVIGRTFMTEVRASDDSRAAARIPSSACLAPLSHAPTHGTAFLLQYDAATVRGDTNSLPNLKVAVTKRLSKLGVRVYWDRASNNEVRILTPLTQRGQIALLENALATRGMLELRLVNESSDELIEQGRVASGYELMKETNMIAGSTTVTAYLVKKEPALTGSHVEQAWTATNDMGGPEIHFQLDPDGAKLFQKLTTDNVGKRLALIVDSHICSVPIIAAPIDGGSGVISCNFSQKEADELADVLDSPLPFPIKVTAEKTN
jgi:preprotein translocase subunit SecD